MPAANAQPASSLRAGASVPILGGCFVLSLVVHVLTAGGISGYYKSASQLDHTKDAGMLLNDMPLPQELPKPETQLGRAESKAATITWLGVRENPTEGDAPESEVDQAELAITQGQSQQSQPAPQQQPQEAQPAPVVVPEPTQETQEQEPQEQVQPEPDPVEPEPEATEPEEVEPTTPIEPTPEAVEPTIEAIETEFIEPEVQEEQPQPETELGTDPVTEPIVEQQQPTEEQPQEQQVQVPPVEASAPVVQGKAGEVDDRESIAAKIKCADVKKAVDLNRPMSSAGLEIKPVEPRYPAAVRFTQLPSNPIMVIRFNANGRVVFTDFLRDEEKRKVYNTGSTVVDEPLISAIYKWRATGEPLKELDPDDPKSYIEITMKIIFRKEN